MFLLHKGEVEIIGSDLLRTDTSKLFSHLLFP